MNAERWLPIPGFEGQYDVSDRGGVRSWLDNPAKKKGDKPYLLSSIFHKSGYLVFALRINGKTRQRPAHRLVLSAFVGVSTLQVNHKNGVKTDNRLDNLEYCTAKENVRHSIDVLGRKRVLPQVKFGEAHHNSKLTDRQVVELRQLAAQGTKQRVLAETYGLSKQQVSNIVLGKSRQEPETNEHKANKAKVQQPVAEAA